MLPKSKKEIYKELKAAELEKRNQSPVHRKVANKKVKKDE